MTMRTRIAASIQGLVDLVDRFRDEQGGVERHFVGHAGRKFCRQRLHPGLHLLGDGQRVGARRQVETHSGGRLAVLSEYLAVRLCAKLDPGDVTHSDDLAGLAGLHDDVGELLRVVKPAQHVQRVLECLSIGGRWCADLSRGHLRALLLQRLDHILGGQPASLHLARIEPDPHGILSGSEHADAADAGQPRDLVLQPDGGEVAEIETVPAIVRRGQRDDLEDRRRFLGHGDALHLHGLWQRCQRARHPVLHQDLREVEIDADVECHRQRVAAIGRGVGLHVDHAFDAVDLLLDRQRHGVDHGPRAGAGISRRNLDGRRHHVGVLRHRQAVERDQADDDHQDGEHIRQDRPLDEEFRDHRRASARVAGGLRLRIDFLTGDGAQQPTHDKRSSALMPFSITRMVVSTSWPITTLRCCTTLSLSTVST